MSSRNSLLPRPGVYDTYWYFAYERQQIFEKRLCGESEPWTNDPIFRQYKFCNSYRALDRVSQFMIRDVCYNPEENSPEDRLFQIVAFRIFSLIETWQAVTELLGRAPIIDDLANGKFRLALEMTENQNGKLYTHAFIVAPVQAYGQDKKYLGHIELLKDMFINQKLGQKLLGAKSLREIYELLHDFPSIGNFMAYQIAIDLNYSAYINFSENDFTKAGPGALRGIHKVFLSTGDLTPEDVIMWMVEHQDKEFARLGYDFHGLFGRKLTAIDCQNIFCETDKYLRAAMPELASERVRIKTKFSKTPQKLDVFLPPKWGLTI